MLSPSKLLRAALVAVMAAGLAGCFQPLYGDRSATATGGNVSTAMAGVDVMQIPAANGTAEARLAVAIREVLMEAVEAGGSSLRDHRQTNGELGYFQHRFRVYDREGEPCTVCGTPVMRIVQSGRSSFFCPSCQK